MPTESDGGAQRVLKARRRRDETQGVAAIHDRVREAILGGELEAGTAIPQHALEARFDAGRTPLREALRMLQREGLVVAEPNRPVRIAPLSAAGFEELLVERIALEAVAIRVTVPLLGSDDFAEFEAALAKMDHYHREGEATGMRMSHREFHRRLIDGCGPAVTAEIDTLADHSERYRLGFTDPGAWKERRAEHRAILAAARDRDPEAAADRLGEHYARIAWLVFGALEPERPLEPLRVALRTVAPGAEAALSRG